MSNSNIVPKLYRNVIEDVIKNVKEAFLNEGVDDQVLQELKQIWESKLLQSRAVDGMPADGVLQARQQYMYPHVIQQAMPQAISRQPQQVTIPSTHVASVSIPGGLAQRQTPSGQTAIIFPEAHAQMQAHAHALNQMTPAASAATLAIPGIQQSQQGATQAGTTRLAPYPTARTIQVAHPIQHQQLHPQIPHLQAQQLAANKQQMTQQQIQTQSQQGRTNKPQMVIQVDGANDSSDDDDDDEDDDDVDDEDEHDKAGDQGNEENVEEEEEPLNSDDDDPDDGATDLFDTENVVVCQFDKIARSRNKWKFHLKDGIMNLKGKDYVFQRATGEAEW
ncbi:transcription initiation factor IIA subunit 1-like [Nematostella vectensis]|uniref:transcription initiation factor IIA subunit 1-like n=1 Tax=Nematostella vectensis TaxID=45351 RepID=UPI00207746A6|nr:transcription initiation factor IIA subunit 1-like [Nematostella vectensis]